MKILYITTHLNKGGITRYLFSLAVGLKQNGHTIIIASSGGELQEEFIKNGLRCISIPIRTKKEISPKAIISYFILKKMISKEPVDIIHAHTRVTQVLAFFLAKKFNAPLVTTCHGFFKPRWHRRAFPCWGDKTIAISSQVKDHLINDFRMKEEDIYLIHNGIELNKSRSYSLEELERLKNRMSISKGCVVVGTVARFSTVKGLDYFIKAMPYVLKENKDTVFLLIGYGPEEKNLKMIAKDLGVEDKIIFFKPSEDSYEYIPVIDIFVMPSIQEGLGISILEAQANKIPVIASNVGGIPDIIEDNVTGILFEPKNELAMSRAILRLIKDKDLALRIKNRAYEKIVKDFSLERMVLETENVYRDAYEEINHAD